MSAIESRTEDQTAHQGHELVPMKGEIEVVPHGLVWEMNDDEFAAFASQFSTAQCAAMIRDAMQQCLACFKRGAEWYYAAGRWLAWVKAKKLHEAYGGWEVFCQDECKISPSQAWKYTEFADRFKPEQVQSFDGERFSLERALGYERPTKEKKTGSGAATEKKTGSEPTKGKKPSSKVATTKAATKADQGEDEEADETPQGDETPGPQEEQPGPGQEDDQEGEKQQQEADKDEPDESAWSYSESTTTAVVLTMPGQFVIKLKDAPSVARLHLDRSQIEKLYRQIEKGLDKDDEYKPDALPE